MTVSRRDFMIASSSVLAATGVSRAAFAAGSGQPDVIVIGAGLSGLGTALALEEAGLRVLVLEGRERVGGRLFTLDDVPGNPEAGGNTVAPAYGRVIARARSTAWSFTTSSHEPSGMDRRSCSSTVAMCRLRTGRSIRATRFPRR